MHLLHEEPNHDLAVFVLTWLPDRGTMPHNHMTWAVVAGIELPFEAIAGGSEGAMVAELKSAYAAQEPIIMMFWQPHWIFAVMDLVEVELPDLTVLSYQELAPEVQVQPLGRVGI